MALQASSGSSILPGSTKNIMSKHKIEIIKRVGIETTPGIKKHSVYPFEVWAIKINDIEMEVVITERDNKHNAFSSQDVLFSSQDVLRFSNKLVSKHEDYKEIRAEVIDKIEERYGVINNSGRRIDVDYTEKI